LKPEGLRKNLITRNIERNGVPINDADLNSMYLDVKVAFDTATKDLVTSIIFSNRIDAYNPLHDFFNEGVDDSAQGADSKYHPNLDLLIQSLDTDTENVDVWVTKWLVSCVASAYGYHSPLVLVLCGELQGTGKSHWIRNLLPKKLRNLAADSKMDAGKDDEILMTKKWIILDDEYGGKSKREEKKLKELTSKEWITVREPYGRVSVDLKRLAVFCGTSNDTQILNDPTGNRRVLPIHILGINQEKYNRCDKNQLWHELYRMYKAGYVHTILKDEIALLNTNTESFKQPTPEEELVYENLAPGDANFGEWLTVTSIIQYLILGTKINTLSSTKIGIILNNSGYKSDRMRRNGPPVKHYWVKRIGDKQQGGAVPNSRGGSILGGSMPHMDENLPF
jgi:predicted P-loop ATPase